MTGRAGDEASVGGPLAPGLAAERTSLAWQRTALSVGLLALALLVHLARSDRPTYAQVLTSLLAAAAASAATTAAVLAARGRTHVGPPFWRLVALVLATAALATAGAVAALVHGLAG